MGKTNIAALWRKLLSTANERFGISHRGVIWLCILFGVAILDIGLGLMLYFGV